MKKQIDTYFKEMINIQVDRLKCFSPLVVKFVQKWQKNLVTIHRRETINQLVAHSWWLRATRRVAWTNFVCPCVKRSGLEI